MAGSTVYFCWLCDTQVPEASESLAEVDGSGARHHFCSAAHRGEYLQIQGL